MSGRSWPGCGRRTPSWRWSVMCSSAAWPSGSRTRWGGSGGRPDRRPEDQHQIPHAMACRALGCPGPGSASTRTVSCRRVRRAGRRWLRRSGGCSPRTGAPTGLRGSLLTCARPGGRSARTPSPRSCASGAWRRSGEEAPVHDRPGKGRWRAPDLVKRDFPARQLNCKWYGDGTEIPTSQGKLYLASVMDVASRVLGFALGEHHDAALAYSALAMAVAVRGGQVPGVILHTDRGSEYTAAPVRQACARLSIRQSMGRPGSAPATAGSGSWHSTPEFELRSVEYFTTRAGGPGPGSAPGSGTTTPADGTPRWA